MIRVLPNRNEREFQTFYIRACSSTDSAQSDWGIRQPTPCLTWNSVNIRPVTQQSTLDILCVTCNSANIGHTQFDL